MSNKAPSNVPHPKLLENLKVNNVKVMYKCEDGAILLWCNYGHHTKQKQGQGFEVWGRGQLILEKISSVVFKFYPRAEITSQAANMHVVYRLN